MACASNYGKGCSVGVTTCPDRFGCPLGVCPDFEIRRHDTKPPLKVEVEDCDGPMNLKNLVVEVNMWAKAKLKKAVTTSETWIGLADNIGFEQVMIGDIIIMDRARLPEHMLVTGFDEAASLVKVKRGYNATIPVAWKKGTPMRVMKAMNAVAESEMVLQDIVQIDGTTLKNQLAHSFLVYEWDAKDTCLPGCYWLEFKLLKMGAPVPGGSPGAPSVVTLTPADYGCTKGVGVDWVRRFPVRGEGYLVKVYDSPTAET